MARSRASTSPRPGIAKAERLAAEHGVTGTWVVADATGWEPPPAAFDLVRGVLPPAPARRASGRRLRVALRALAPGGTFLLVAHDLLNLTEGHGGPQDPGVLTTAEGVLDDLAAGSLELGLELVTERAERVDRVVRVDDRGGAPPSTPSCGPVASTPPPAAAAGTGATA